MVEKVSLDAIFTALTCLSSSSDFAFSPVYLNSQTAVRANNFSIDCQLQAVDRLNGQIAHLTQKINELQNDVNIFKGVIRNFENSTNLIPNNCEAQRNGVVQIKVNSKIDPFYVVCDQETYGGSWLIFAQRFDGTTDFYRTWDDYKFGFGNLDGEFFLGLDKLHEITNGELQELLVVLESAEKETRIAHYTQFSIGNENEKYKINLLGKYDGNAGDALRYHAGFKFSTFDQDNDNHQQNCAKMHAGAWWYAACVKSNLFGVFQRFGEPDMQDFKGIIWTGFLNGPKGSLKKIKMLLRPYRI